MADGRKNKAITPAQIRVLDFIRAFIKGNGYPPTREEIKDGLGFASKNAASDHLKALEKKGYITRTPEVSRGIKITRKQIPKG